MPGGMPLLRWQVSCCIPRACFSQGLNRHCHVRLHAARWSRTCAVDRVVESVLSPRVFRASFPVSLHGLFEPSLPKSFFCRVLSCWIGSAWILLVGEVSCFEEIARSVFENAHLGLQKQEFFLKEETPNPLQEVLTSEREPDGVLC